MARTPQEIFRVLVLHNKLLQAEDLDAFMGPAVDPLEVIETLVAAEMLSTHMAEKLRTLYLKNLEKQGLVPAGTAAAAAAVAEPAEEEEPAETAAVETFTAEEVATAPAALAAERERIALEVRAPQGAAGGSGDGLLQRLLQAAREAGASDLHVRAGSVPIVRVVAVLRELHEPALSPADCERALLSILTAEQRENFGVTHDLDFSHDGGPRLGRFRVSYLMEHQGIDGIFRLIPPRVPSFDELKLPETLKRFTAYRQGIVLVTGPKGSGKTTTLAALIDLINATRREHIITIEDPIEFVHQCKKGHVNQREVGPHTRSFANALRASLREAPDVIMVGEMRDLETTSLAITAAETGHLVFATLHTSDAPRTIGRVLDVFPPKEQGQIRAMFSESMRGVVSQQLIPATDGRTMHLALEVLVNTPAVGNLIRDSREFQVKGVMQVGKRLGMCLMDESLLRLARAGKISREEAVARADNVAMMEKDLAAG